MSAATIADTLRIEATAKANGWSEEKLVNLAGERLGFAIGRHFPHPGHAIGYLGKGHNAADTLVALRILRDQFGWKCLARLAHPITVWDALTLKKWDELGIDKPLERMPAWRDFEGPLLLLDGLLGSGSKGSLREPLVELAEEMSTLRQGAGARVAAIDIPSGIDPDSGRIFPGTVVADVTFMIGHAKCGLLHGHAAAATGALALVPVEPLSIAAPGPMEIISPSNAGPREGAAPV